MQLTLSYIKNIDLYQPNIVQKLIPLLEDPNYTLRTNAARTIGPDFPPRSEQYLPHYAPIQSIDRALVNIDNLHDHLILHSAPV
jgi:hypothetical protein